MEKNKLQKGMKVTYVHRHSSRYSDCELGIVTSQNENFVFVDYGGGTSQATSINLLLEGDETFYCHDENNSVLDGAFGRCSKRCSKCGG